MVAGVGLAAAKSALDLMVEVAKRKLLVRAEIDSRDDVYRWVMQWLATNKRLQATNTFSISSSLAAFGTSALANSMEPGQKVVYLPAPGDHLVRFQGHWIWISRSRLTGNPQMAANARLLMETLKITAATGGKRIVHALVEEAKEQYEAAVRERTVVYSVDQDGYWAQVGSRPMRPLTTVVLPANQAQAVLEDCREFLGSEQWYSHHGVPYRRGYLLYGHPGTGKTSLVTALAGELQLDVYVVTLSSKSMTDEMLRSLLNSAGARSILLLEDVDAAFVGRATGEDQGGRLTFSGLLNAVDGVAAQEGRLLFMTTNHIDRLSSALIRPGRIDVRVQFSLATAPQIRALFLSFYQDLPPSHGPPSSAPGVLPVSVPLTTTSPTATTPSILPSSPATTAAATAPPAAPLTAAPATPSTSAAGAPHSGTDAGMGAAASNGATAGSSGNASGRHRMSGGTGSGDPPGSSRMQASAAAPAAGPATQPPTTRETAAGPHSHRIATAPTAGEQAVTAALVAGGVGGSGGAGLDGRLERLADQFAAAVPEGVVSMAQLQGYLMAYKFDPEGAVSNAHTLVEGGGGGGSTGGGVAEGL